MNFCDINPFIRFAEHISHPNSQKSLSMCWTAEYCTSLPERQTFLLNLNIMN